MTINSRADRIRRIIKSSSMQRMSVVELSRLLNVSVHVIHNELKKMADIYIIDWQKPKGGSSWHALYACAHVPEDAPRPDLQTTKATLMRGIPRSAINAPQTHWIT